MPFMQCCRGSRAESPARGQGDVDELCDLYRRARPSQRCSDDYRPPQIAAAFGDPHFFTFDGLNYTFNGYGEFTLANFSDGQFVLQGRSTPPTGTTGGTVFTALAFKAIDSDVIHVETNGDGAGIDVYVRHDGAPFQKLALNASKTWYLSNVTIYVGSGNDSASLLAICDKGIALTVRARGGALSVTVVAKGEFKGETRGMLGTWDNDAQNELQRPDDVIVPSNSSMVTILDEFGKMWEVRPGMSLFYYKHGCNQSTYTNHSYRPSFMRPNISLPGVSEVCGGDEMCAFDWLTTGSWDIATQSLHSVEEFIAAKNDLVSPVVVIPTVTCPPISIPNGGVEYGNGSVPGSTQRIVCDRCHELAPPDGQPVLTCLHSGSWSTTTVSCQPRETRCQQLSPPVNGAMQIDRCRRGTPASFSCDSGYLLVGAREIECSAESGEWGGPVPTCDQKEEKLMKTLSSESQQRSSSLSMMAAATIGGACGAIVLLGVLLLALAFALRDHRKRVRQIRESKKRTEREWKTTPNDYVTVSSI